MRVKTTAVILSQTIDIFIKNLIIFRSVKTNGDVTSGEMMYQGRTTPQSFDTPRDEEVNTCLFFASK